MENEHILATASLTSVITVYFHMKVMWNLRLNSRMSMACLNFVVDLISKIVYYKIQNDLFVT